MHTPQKLHFDDWIAISRKQKSPSEPGMHWVRLRTREMDLAVVGTRTIYHPSHRGRRLSAEKKWKGPLGLPINILTDLMFSSRAVEYFWTTVELAAETSSKNVPGKPRVLLKALVGRQRGKKTDGGANDDDDSSTYATLRYTQRTGHFCSRGWGITKRVGCPPRFGARKFVGRGRSMISRPNCWALVLPHTALGPK